MDEGLLGDGEALVHANGASAEVPGAVVALQVALTTFVIPNGVGETIHLLLQGCNLALLGGQLLQPVENSQQLIERHTREVGGFAG